MLLGSEGIDQCGMLGRMDGFLFAVNLELRLKAWERLQA